MIIECNEKNIQDLKKYKKAQGIFLIKKYLKNLNPIKKMYVIDSIDDWLKVEDEFPEQMMTIRCDCPRGIEAKIPQGQTFERNRVINYINNTKKEIPDCVFILQDMIEGTNERIHTQGACNLFINVGKEIDMDYVGPGFDCGEISKGIAVHETWIIPWEEGMLLNAMSINLFKSNQINQINYEGTLKRRQDFLINSYPDKKEEILNTIPNEYKNIKISTLTNIINNLIKPICEEELLLKKDKITDFGVETNIISNGRIVPFEIALSERFKKF